jgi:hypothetical protein
MFSKLVNNCVLAGFKQTSFEMIFINTNTSFNRRNALLFLPHGLKLIPSLLKLVYNDCQSIYMLYSTLQEIDFVITVLPA